jgi:hypothetical protein
LTGWKKVDRLIDISMTISVVVTFLSTLIVLRGRMGKGKGVVASFLLELENLGSWSFLQVGACKLGIWSLLLVVAGKSWICSFLQVEPINRGLDPPSSSCSRIWKLVLPMNVLI